MFNEFERMSSQESNKPSAPQANAGAGSIPGMNEADMDGMEKQFMGMFQNIAKQIENLEDEDDS